MLKFAVTTKQQTVVRYVPDVKFLEVCCNDSIFAYMPSLHFIYRITLITLI